MAADALANLTKAGWMVPKPAPAAGDYVGFAVEGGLVFVSGQLPFDADGALQYIGRLGREFGVDEGQAAARLCALNVVAQIQAACDGDLGRVRRILRLGVFVNATAEFGDHPKVANAASAVMKTAFGEAGLHTRAAVGCVSLPRGVAVEVEATAAIG